MARRRLGLVPALVLVALVLCTATVVLGCGSGGGAPITTAATAPATTGSTALPPTTATTQAPTTTIAPTTTTEAATTTTESPTAAAEKRWAAYQELMQVVKTSDKDMTAEIAAFLAPKEQAQAKAPSYQKAMRTPPDSWAVVTGYAPDMVVRSTLSDDGVRVKIVSLEKLTCRDGLTTRGIAVSNLENDGGEWLMSTVFPDPFALVEGDSLRIGDAAKIGDLVWEPTVLYEEKHLGVNGGPVADGMFLTVGFYIVNQGQTNATPALWKVTAVDANGTEYPDFVAGEKYVYSLTGENRSMVWKPGAKLWLWSVYAVPEGTDLAKLSFKIAGPLQD